MSSMPLSSPTASIGAAPQAASSGVLTELDQAGAYSTDAAAGGAAAPASPYAKYMLPVGGLAIAGGGLLAMNIAKKKAAQSVSSLAVQRALQPAALDGVSHLAAAAPKGGGFLKWGGIAALVAGAGLAVTGLFSHSKTMKAEAQQAELEAAYAAQLQQQQLLQQQGGGSTGQDPAGTNTNLQNLIDYGHQTGTLPAGFTGGQSGAAAAPQAAGAPTATAPSAGTPAAAAPAAGAAVPAAGVTGAPASLVGSSITLASGIGPTGQPIAQGGSFTIASDLGAFGTLDQANAAIYAAMADPQLGAANLRYAVVQNSTGFHAVLADGGSFSSSAPLTAQQGTVVGWSAANYVVDGSGNGTWQAYTWDQQRGPRAQQFQPGQAPFAQTAPQVAPQQGQQLAPSVAGGGAPAPGAQPVGTAPTGAPANVLAGGAAAPTAQAGAAFDPATILGQTFAVNATTVGGGNVVPGGQVQIQQFVPASAGGFGTADEAAKVAQQLAPSLQAANPYARVLTLRGGDGHFYLYTGSVVARPTAALQQAAPVHVIGRGFASYFDANANAWQSVPAA